MPNVAAVAASPNKQALFSTPTDSLTPVQEMLSGLGPDIARQLNNHTTQIYAYDGHAAVTLKVPGFFDANADGKSQCLIYDQAHYLTKTLDGYEYDIGWAQRLVIKVTTWKATAALTVPSAVAASCDVGESKALVQYVVRGLSGTYKNLTGDAAQFGVDQFAQYRIKMQGLLDELDNGKTGVVPVVIARTKIQDEPTTNRRDRYRDYAYHLAGVAGILKGSTADDWYIYLTTKGKDQSGKPQKIADEALCRHAIDEAYADYGIGRGKLSDLSKPDQNALVNTIISELDGYKTGRASFV
jgi:hypothetical protein